MSSKHWRRFTRRGGFTLVEAAVTMTVGVVAVAALLPALNEAQQQSIVTSCLSNQSTLGVGIATYINNYNELPGINYQEGTYWAKPLGQPYFYGGLQAWMRNGPNSPTWTDANDGLGGPPGRPTGYSGIGFIQPLIGGDGKVFYCPGSKASFEGTDRRPWFDYWKGTGNVPYPNGDEQTLEYYGFGQQDKGAITTYFYRGGNYEREDLDSSDPRWAPGNPNWNWTRDQLVHPSDDFVQNKPMLTCFWAGYRDDANWQQVQPNTDAINHEGTQTNLLYTDGSARTWDLPSNVSPLWGWFDAGAYTEGEFHTGSLANGFTATGAGPPVDDFYMQLPWYWVAARRGIAAQ